MRYLKSGNAKRVKATERFSIRPGIDGMCEEVKCQDMNTSAIELKGICNVSKV